jgi:hypothetical protein
LDNLNKFTCMTYEGAARLLCVSVWKIRYAVESRYLSGPSVVLKRRALFSPDQVEAMKQFFEMEEAVKREKEIHVVSERGPEGATVKSSDE